MASSTQPSSTTIQTLKGLAIGTTLIHLTQTTTTSILLPALYPLASYSPRLAAQQFALQYKILASTTFPCEVLATSVCAILAYASHTTSRSGASQQTWKLWTAAAAAMGLVLPYTTLLMTATAKKLLWVSEVADSATVPTAKASSSGVGIFVSTDTAAPLSNRDAQASAEAGLANLSGTTLGLPPNGAKGSGPQGGAITPMEEFEPFEDAPMDEREYEQLKVVKLLQRYGFANLGRVVGSVGASGLALWAVLGEY